MQINNEDNEQRKKELRRMHQNSNNELEHHSKFLIRTKEEIQD